MRTATIRQHPVLNATAELASRGQQRAPRVQIRPRNGILALHLLQCRIVLQPTGPQFPASNVRAAPSATWRTVFSSTISGEPSPVTPVAPRRATPAFNRVGALADVILRRSLGLVLFLGRALVIDGSIVVSRLLGSLTLLDRATAARTPPPIPASKRQRLKPMTVIPEDEFAELFRPSGVKHRSPFTGSNPRHFTQRCD
jgi:hypothetical protein